MPRVSLLLPLLIMPGAALAAVDVLPATYQCERGIEIPAVYVNTDDASLVIVHVEGHLVTLDQEISASGARYGTGAAGYVWWNKGRNASLFWKAGEDATGEDETLLLGECEEVEQP